MAAGKGVNPVPIPDDFTKRMIVRYGHEATDELVEALSSEPSVSLQLNPIKKWKEFVDAYAVPWYPLGRILEDRPLFTLDPLYHAGIYYSQESSSMFLAHILQHLPLNDSKDLRFLDMCAAPGGKSLLLAHALDERGVLYSNEIHKGRNAVLLENLIKSGRENFVTTAGSAAAWGHVESFFDLILVDAPCSGEGMFRKDMQARSEWSMANVQMCAQRQIEILDALIPALRPNGFLIYSTCTFASEENEEIMAHLIAKHGFRAVHIPVDDVWSVDTVEVMGAAGFRFWPGRTPGEGLFMTVLQAPDGPLHIFRRKPKSLFHALEKKHWKQVEPWIPSATAMLDPRGMIYQCPVDWEELNTIAQQVYVTSLGLPAGELKREDFIPDAALALSCKDHFPVDTIELGLQEALAFLRGDTFELPHGQGVGRITYQNFGLGWVKRMGSRHNNYFPKEWRIRMR
jgi:16S rRNA C967 or C1407 C5-methylase (RsmB/RsmF family)/NOL1/NOP2/fmu family ribosome biogenesis protein